MLPPRSFSGIFDPQRVLQHEHAEALILKVVVRFLFVVGILHNVATHQIILL